VGLRQNEENDKNNYELSQWQWFMTVPYDRMNEEMQRITRGRIVSIQPLTAESAL